MAKLEVTTQVGIQIISLGFIMVILLLRRDEYFPFSKDIEETGYALISLLYSTLIFCTLLIFTYAKSLTRKFHIEQQKIQINKNLLLIPTLISILTITFFHYYNNIVYREFYNLNIVSLFVITLVSILLITIPVLINRKKLAVLGLIGGVTLLTLIPIFYFPISAKLSDLPPIVQEQSRVLLRGENIYQYYLLDNNVLTQAVRQPGTIVSYLPAEVLKIDPRFMSLIYFGLIGIVIP